MGLAADRLRRCTEPITVHELAGAHRACWACPTRRFVSESIGGAGAIGSRTAPRRGAFRKMGPPSQCSRLRGCLATRRGRGSTIRARMPRCGRGSRPTERAACLDYLDWLRWPDGFRCPLCRGTKAWKLPDGRWSCGVCGRRVSATAGTIFHGTRTPLTVVRCGVADGEPEAGDLGAGAEADAGDRL